RRSVIKGAPGGKLAGKTIALKDNICVAGVPMMNGAATLEGYVPDVDATIVTRILDAGGTILGKVHCEYFCCSGSSHTASRGWVHNPWRRGYSAGGSSSGSAAVVAGGEADMAIGCDQAGSIRIPASYCGVYGMKPTHWLVPYTGILPLDLTIDHAGPMTASVADNALLLEVLAGPDGLDPRQYSPRVAPYTEALGKGARGLKIAAVTEGFGRPESEPDVDAKVREGAERLARLGAEVEDVSIPMHLDAVAIWGAVCFEGALSLVFDGNGSGSNWSGLYVTSLRDAVSGWRRRVDEFPDNLKLILLLGRFLDQQYHGHYYAKGQNLVRKLRAAYDAVLDRFDLLLMPTLPLKAPPLPPADAPRALKLQRSFEMLVNTPAFNVTHHPAMTLPCGLSDGLPVGLMLVGRHYDESTIYRAAHAFEESGDWRTM
ncbi:MAG: amidase, partial [Stellaceae bacterium]